MAFSTRRGGGSSSNGPDDEPEFDDYEAYDDEYDYDASYGDDDNDDQEEGRPVSRRTIRARSGNSGGGRSVSSSYGPEERYWTDYLRIALPIIGLLLMLGLLWFWATQLIGDDRDTTEPESTNVAEVATSTPDETDKDVEGDEKPTDLTTNSTPKPDDTIGISDNKATAVPTTATEAGPTAAPTEPPADTELAAGDTAVVNDNEINVRPDASTQGDPITQLNEGDKVTIVSGPVEADGYTWYEIITEDGLTNGFIVADYLDPAL